MYKLSRGYSLGDVVLVGAVLVGLSLGSIALVCFVLYVLVHFLIKFW